MDTQNTRVTRAQAAELAGVSTRQISRWAAAGLLSVTRDPNPWTQAALYDPEEVMVAGEKWAERLATMRDLSLPESTQDRNKTG